MSYNNCPQCGELPQESSIQPNLAFDGSCRFPSLIEEQSFVRIEYDGTNRINDDPGFGVFVWHENLI